MGLPPDDVKVRSQQPGAARGDAAPAVLKDRPEVFAPLCVAIDKLDKIGADAVTELLADPAGDVGPRRRRTRRLRGGPGSALRDLEEATPHAPADSPARRSCARLFELLDAYGLADRVVFDASIVRGLAYYTGIVFEAFDAGRSLRAICGGGRYDRLLETWAARPPAVGFGFGDVVIAELLADKGLLPDCARALDAVVFAFGEAERPAAVRWPRASCGADDAIGGAGAGPAEAQARAGRRGQGRRPRVYLIGPTSSPAGRGAGARPRERRADPEPIPD